jgi:hypothetical protein
LFILPFRPVKPIPPASELAGVSFKIQNRS